jgi:hypothetical protein
MPSRADAVGCCLVAVTPANNKARPTAVTAIISDWAAATRVIRSVSEDRITSCPCFGSRSRAAAALPGSYDAIQVKEHFPLPRDAHTAAFHALAAGILVRKSR